MKNLPINIGVIIFCLFIYWRWSVHAPTCHSGSRCDVYILFQMNYKFESYVRNFYNKCGFYPSSLKNINTISFENYDFIKGDKYPFNCEEGESKNVTLYLDDYEDTFLLKYEANDSDINLKVFKYGIEFDTFIYSILEKEVVFKKKVNRAEYQQEFIKEL